MVSGIDGGMVDPSTMWQNLLNKADKDKDGKISQSEFEALAPQNGSGPNMDNLFKQMDTNKDGFIDETEMKAALKKMHRHGHHSMPNPAAMFKAADKNGDGQVSLEEFKAMMSPDKAGSDAETLFKRFDTNGDGVIDQSESQAAIQEMAQKKGPMAPQQDSFSTLA